MIIGIAGCTALVLTGLGVRDSVVNLAEFQYGNIETHDIEVVFSDTVTEEDMDEVKDAAGTGITGSVPLYKTSVEYHTDSAVKTVYIVAAEPDSMDSYMHFELMEGEENYPEYGEIFLSQKIAEIDRIDMAESLKSIE